MLGKLFITLKGFNAAAMKFDLHIHSHLSYDSLSSINAIVQYARKRDLRGIAITDHNISASDTIVRTDLDSDLWIIKGNEVKTDIGDIIGLFISGPLRNTKANALIDEIHDQGGIAVLAHPFKYRRNYPPLLLEKLDAVEVINSRWIDLGSLKANPAVDQLLATVKGRSAGSDAHFPFEVGRACWVTPHIKTPEDLKKSICSNSGQAFACRTSEWLDGASQCVKFIKHPSARQLAYITYRLLRRRAFAGRKEIS